MTANPVRPARYRPGKPIAEDPSSSESSDAEPEDPRQQPNEQSQAPNSKRAPPPKATSFPADAKKLTSNLKNVDLEARRRQAEVQERARLEQERRERAERERLERDAGFVTDDEDEGGADEEDDDEEDVVDQDAVVLRPVLHQQRGARKPQNAKPGDEEEDSEDDSSSEEESSSDDERTAPKLLRPVFLKKSQRDASTTNSIPTPDPAIQASLDAARRQADADALVQEKLERDAVARAAGKLNWDDDGPDILGAVDDTDGLDPELERAQWVARELARLKRGRQALEEKEKEIEEVERRRNMDVGEREEEDRKFVEEQKMEKAGRDKAAFMARYHHKGAFFLDDDGGEAGGGGEGEGAGKATGEALSKRNLMGAQYANREGMTEAMPEYLQVRDVTKIGRKGRTRYKDMRSEDTGRWGDFGRDFGEGVGYERGQRDDAFRRDDGDERFKADGGQRPTGANAGRLGERDRDRNGDRDRDRHRKRPYGYDDEKERERERKDESKRARV